MIKEYTFKDLPTDVIIYFHNIAINDGNNISTIPNIIGFKNYISVVIILIYRVYMDRKKYFHHRLM
jgi:hypothetical protein